MATVKSIYEGCLRSRAEHLQSGTVIITDAPTDNHGKGEAFSPTDLVATALGSCILTIMALAVEARGNSIEGTRLEITKIMAADPRRIGEIVIHFYFPRDYDERIKRVLEAAGKECPVARSLHPDLKQTLHFHYPAE